MSIRPRRSVLYMPGSNARAIDKARTLPVDGAILDLEDAVAPDAKEAARAQVVEALKAGGFGAREVFVRVNGIGTQWFADDLAAFAHVAPDAILLPKIQSPDQLESVGTRLLDMHADRRIHIWAMIETPIALFNIQALAAEARDSEARLAGFVLGTNDLAKETRARLVPGRAPMLPWLMTCIAAAHAYGIDVLDGVYNDIGNADGFAAECVQGRDMGFDGKTLIHPSQIEPCNAAFTPAPEEVAEARRIIAAFEEPENRGKGVVKLDGRMVERMHADIARRVVAIADAISKQ
jgi:citrate lyase subunit beta / citryl-CoA lyase